LFIVLGVYWMFKKHYFFMILLAICSFVTISYSSDDGSNGQKSSSNSQQQLLDERSNMPFKNRINGCSACKALVAKVEAEKHRLEDESAFWKFYCKITGYALLGLITTALIFDLTLHNQHELKPQNPCSIDVRVPEGSSVLNIEPRNPVTGGQEAWEVLIHSTSDTTPNPQFFPKESEGESNPLNCRMIGTRERTLENGQQFYKIYVECEKPNSKS
jgi:hypothetical protein